VEKCWRCAWRWNIRSLEFVPEPSPERFSIGRFHICAVGTWHSEFDKNSTDSCCFIFKFGGFGALFGGANPTKAPGGDGTGLCIFIETFSWDKVSLASCCSWCNTPRSDGRATAWDSVTFKLRYYMHTLFLGKLVLHRQAIKTF